MKKKRYGRIKGIRIVLTVCICITLWALLMQIVNVVESISVFRDYNEYNIARDLDGGIPFFLQSDERWAEKNMAAAIWKSADAGLLAFPWSGVV